MSDAGRRPDDEPVTRGFCSGKMDPITSNLGQIKGEFGDVKKTLKDHGEALFGVSEYGTQKGGLVNMLGDVKRIVTEMNDEGSKPLQRLTVEFNGFKKDYRNNGVQHKTRWQTYGVLIQGILYLVGIVVAAYIARR